jgi:cytochrome c553
MMVKYLRKSNLLRLCVCSLALLLVASWPAEASELDDTIALCVSCHGEKGMPVEPDMPIIWGQEFYYIYVQLKDYKAARRHSEVMNDVVADLDKAEMKAISQHFSERPWPPTGFQSTRDDDAKGMTAATAGQCFQ